jgi:outer membrane translocation and assembly module TamA
LGGEFRLTDHYYEFYRSSPREGFDIRAEVNLTEKDVLSSVSGNLFRIGFEKLWNLSNWDPPSIVIGLRGRLGTTLTGENLSDVRLPTDFRHFLGGSTDMRGFGLRELPGVNGALTAIYFGVESRFLDLLPIGLQPFVFVDGAVFGQEPAALDGPIFYSPGVGIRWQTQFGVVRTTL